MRHKIIYLVVVLCGMVYQPNTMAQTVNTGELTISPNTQFATVENLDNQEGAILINDGEAFIYSHFNNDGTVDFTAGQEGLTRFIGSNIQEVSGSAPSYVNHVVWDNTASNTASFELLGELSISGEANFNEGVVNNRDYGGQLIFENDATHTGVYDGSHVDGAVQKLEDDGFTFPIGHEGFYREAVISAPDNTASLFTGQYFLEDSGVLYPHENRTGVLELIDNTEYWTVTRHARQSDIILTLGWHTGTTQEAIYANPQLDAIRIVRWDEAHNLWVDEGGVVDVDNQTVTTPIRLDGTGVFTLGRVKEGIVLPGDVVVYNWVTPDGDGKNDYFFIDNINTLPNNKVEIFNRWGVKVFKTTQYDTNDNVFRGYSEGRLTLGDGLLPTGTYFYVLSYDYVTAETSERVEQAGFLYLNGGD